MSQPAPTTAHALTELEKLLALPPAARGGPAWRLVAAAAGRPNFGPVLDFALENGLIQPAGPDHLGGDPVPTWVNPADGSEMVWVPPGGFVAGADNKPAACGGFSLARYPVTNEQFARFVAETGYRPPADPPPDAHGEDCPNGGFLEHWTADRPPTRKERHPVVFVSYLDALAYCRWAGLSLPGEFLWEKAARGPDGRRFPWGDDAGAAAKVAWVTAATTGRVDAFPKTRTPYGCEQMVGNVSEWCQPGDPEAPGSFPPVDPVVSPGRPGKPVYAAVRGSAFMRSDVSRMVGSHRRRLSVTRRNRWVGFRPALLLPCRPVG